MSYSNSAWAGSERPLDSLKETVSAIGEFLSTINVGSSASFFEDGGTLIGAALGTAAAKSPTGAAFGAYLGGKVGEALDSYIELPGEKNTNVVRSDRDIDFTFLGRSDTGDGYQYSAMVNDFKLTFRPGATLSGCYLEITGTSGSDSILGCGSVNKFSGGLGNDSLYGDAGNDFLYGDAGNDKLYGGTGNDRLIGGSLGDKLIGGAGKDTMSGGDGDGDVFYFDKGDTVTDFEMNVNDQDYTSGLNKIASFTTAPSGFSNWRYVTSVTDVEGNHIKFADKFSDGGDPYTLAEINQVMAGAELDHILS